VGSGKKHLAAILSRLPGETAGKVLAYISGKNQALGQELERMMFGFAEVLMLSDKEMQRLHADIDPKDLVLALKGLDEAERDRLLRGLSAKRKTVLLEEAEQMGGVKRKAVEAAQNRIAEAARKLIESGEISPGEVWIE